MDRFVKTLIGVLVAVGALAAAACSAGDTHVTLATPEQTGIAVSGTGMASAVPDIAVLSLGVEVTRTSVGDARNAAASAMEGVRGSLRRNGVEDRDVSTEAFQHPAAVRLVLW